MKRKLKRLLIKIVLIVAALYIIRYQFSDSTLQHNISVNYTELKSKCECQKETIYYYIDANRIYTRTERYNFDRFNTSYVNNSYLKNYRFTCDLYNVLRRGSKQRVIGLSLYGSNRNYFKHLISNSKAAKILYPDWIIRVYHDNSFENSILCQIACDHPNIDFCDVTDLKYFSPDLRNLSSFDASYVHAMMWRWFPIGDEFVDYFSSRDTDSLLIERERKAVNEWIENKNLFHIMRDHPLHNTEILGGMWGFANILNRSYGRELYEKIIDTGHSYNPTRMNYKMSDQTFLTGEFWPYALLNSTIHDSYHCKSFKGQNAQPFPQQRRNDSYCFVACFDPCCDIKFRPGEPRPTIHECPPECRPSNHQDWIYC